MGKNISDPKGLAILKRIRDNGFIIVHQDGKNYKMPIDVFISHLSGDYLPLAGGTMTGDIVMSDTLKISDDSETSSIEFFTGNLTLKGGDVTSTEIVLNNTNINLTAENTVVFSNIVMGDGTTQYYIYSPDQLSYVSLVDTTVSIHSDDGVDTSHINVEGGIVHVNPGVSLNIDGPNTNINTTSFHIQNLPTYADNAAAVAGGLGLNAVYKTATGELRIVIP